MTFDLLTSKLVLYLSQTHNMGDLTLILGCLWRAFFFVLGKARDRQKDIRTTACNQRCGLSEVQSHKKGKDFPILDTERWDLS